MNLASSCTVSGCTVITRMPGRPTSIKWSEPGLPNPREAAGYACYQGNGTMASVESALRQAVSDLNAIRVRWALVGGLAVSARAVPRFTKDLDFAVAVPDDGQAEHVVHQLRARVMNRWKCLSGLRKALVWCPAGASGLQCHRGPAVRELGALRTKSCPGPTRLRYCPS